jgi:hypothetical protein
LSPYRTRARRALIDEIPTIQRRALAQEYIEAMRIADEPQPFTTLRWNFNWVDKLALVWAIIVVLMILWMQQPGGFARSLQSENIGEWGHLLFSVVAIPWGVLRVLTGLFSRH